MWASRESGDLKGYYVAGKRLPSWVIAFSSNATGESAWLLLGLTGMGYAIGVHAFWVILGEVLGVAAAWIFVARPFKEYTDRFDSITVPDYLTDRFRDTSHVFRWLSAVIVLSMVMAYTAAQLTASGRAFDSFLGTGYTQGVWIGLGIVLFYTTVGGFKAVAYSDFVQGVLMLGCLIMLPIVGVIAAGGLSEMFSALGAADPALHGERKRSRQQQYHAAGAQHDQSPPQARDHPQVRLPSPEGPINGLEPSSGQSLTIQRGRDHSGVPP